jgi:hypothetical protein
MRYRILRRPMEFYVKLLGRFGTFLSRELRSQNGMKLLKEFYATSGVQSDLGV